MLISSGTWGAKEKKRKTKQSRKIILGKHFKAICKWFPFVFLKKRIHSAENSLWFLPMWSNLYQIIFLFTEKQILTVPFSHSSDAGDVAGRRKPIAVSAFSFLLTFFYKCRAIYMLSLTFFSLQNKFRLPTHKPSSELRCILPSQAAPTRMQIPSGCIHGTTSLSQPGTAGPPSPPRAQLLLNAMPLSSFSSRCSPPNFST